MTKIIENMEIGHNVMHGQWNWMNDPEIHSSTWERDMSAASKHWISAHNIAHREYTNILSMDDDVGYFILRVTRDQPSWRSGSSGESVCRPSISKKVLKPGPDRDITLKPTRKFSSKAGRRVLKDYVAFPALTLLSPAATYTSTLKANAVANVIRNICANAVIFGGHFPDGAEKFTKTDMIGETRGQWYLRQMLGSANFEAGPALHFLSSNLRHQINTIYNPICPVTGCRRFQCECAKSATSTTCPTPQVHSYRSTRKRGAPSPSFCCRTRICATTPTTHRRPRSERMFRRLEPGFLGTDPATGRRGLKTAIDAIRQRHHAPRVKSGRCASTFPSSGGEATAELLVSESG
ncbi:fatty acid desaturase [Mycobacterium colombiense]|uniref:fatty acid desaturase n=1 Tax=Mycobacterium colombiense TaxID=339268 RepID=UPI001F0BA8A3|nr:fatty acid desaturase [Mycobacterium colombiense]